MQGFEARTGANAAWMEHQILDHVKQALRVTLDWHVPAVGIQRKISSLDFTLKSFQRHLERIMNLEEQDGYMVLVVETNPNMHFRVERLEREHRKFRKMLDRLLPEVESLCQCSKNVSEESGIQEVCDQILGLLEKVDQHDAEEVQLLQDTLLIDEGGEG